MIQFKCINGKKESWEGKIVYVKEYSSHYEIRIESRSGITVLVGETLNGGFACVPDFGVGCNIANLEDKFWNTESLIKVLGEVDGLTVATALSELSNEIKI